MIKQFINDILSIAHKHILVGDTSYKREWNVNDQHNHRYYQFIISNEGLLQQVSSSAMRYKTNVLVLGRGDAIDVQEQALHIFLDVLEMIDDELSDIEIEEWNAMDIVEYSDDNCSGIRATVTFILPIPINLCEYREHFIEKPETETEQLDLTNEDECTSTKNTTFQNKKIDLNPLKLY